MNPFCLFGQLWIVLILAATGTGCGRNDAGSPTATLQANATTVQSVFGNASADVKQQAGEVVAAVQSQNSVAAYTRLESLSARPELTSEQQQAVTEMRTALVRQLQAESLKGNAAAEELLNKYRATK